MRVNIYVPDAMHEAMRELPGTNWSAVFQHAVTGHLSGKNGHLFQIGDSLKERVAVLELYVEGLVAKARGKP